MLRVIAITTSAAMWIATASAQTGTNIPRPLPPPEPPQIKPIEPSDPRAPARLDTFGDKVKRCLHYGGSRGVPPAEAGRYTSRCVHAQ